MKTFYNVVNAIIRCAREARALIVLDINECNLASKVVKNCRVIARFKQGKKEQILTEVCMIKKTAPHSTVFFRRDEKVYLKGWFTRHQICRQDLLAK